MSISYNWEGKKAGMAHLDCGWTCGCAGKTVKYLENTYHTWALLSDDSQRCAISSVRTFNLPLPLPLPLAIALAAALAAVQTWRSEWGLVEQVDHRRRWHCEQSAVSVDRSHCCHWVDMPTYNDSQNSLSLNQECWRWLSAPSDSLRGWLPTSASTQHSMTFPETGTGNYLAPFILAIVFQQ